MAAFNYIVFDYVCPCCNEKTKITAQTHIASDYDGDDTGWFMNRVYNIGQKMAWFNSSEEEYEDWMTWGKPEKGETVAEYCYSECDTCKCKLFALIEFENITPIKIREVGLKKNCPDF